MTGPADVMRWEEASNEEIGALLASYCPFWPQGLIDHPGLAEALLPYLADLPADWADIIRQVADAQQRGLPIVVPELN